MRPLIVSMVLASLAHAQEPPRSACLDRPGDGGLFDGPVRIGLLAGDLGSGHRYCPRSELSLGARARAIIDVPSFYGNLGIDTRLEASYSFSGKGELFTSLSFLSWQFAQNATLTGTSLGAGPFSVGGSVVALDRPNVIITPYARLLLPSDGRTMGGELGVSIGGPFSKMFSSHALFAGHLSAGVAAGPADVRLGFLMLVGVVWTPARWFSFTLDAQLHFGSRGPLDWFAPAAALRFRLWRGLGAELSAVVPVVGEDRHDAVLLLRFGWRM
jgi:hypothetical protein